MDIRDHVIDCLFNQPDWAGRKIVEINDRFDDRIILIYDDESIETILFCEGKVINYLGL